MGTFSKPWAINAALIAGSLMLVLYAEISLRNDPRQLVAAFEESAQEWVARSARLARSAHADYEEETLASLPANPNNGPFYRLDDRYGEAQASTASRWLGVSRKSKNVLALEFDEEEEPVLRSAKGLSQLETRDGALRVVTSGVDHLVSVDPLQIPAAAVGEISIRIRVDRGTRLGLSWATERAPDVPDDKGLDLNLVADGAFHTYSVDVKSTFAENLEWDDRIVRLFLIPSNEVGATAEIDFIRFVSRHAKYSSSPRGTSTESLGGVWRRALYMLPTQQLTWSLRVPDEAPVLDFGTGVLIDEIPLKFEVLIAAAGGNARLFERVVDSSRLWEDARIDLAPWAGQEVELALRASGSSENVALWSNPHVSSAPLERMNVVVVLEDALRADLLSTQGYWRETSPRRTELMEDDGIVFLNAFSQATKTRPSIPSLMTSLLPTATGVWNFADMLDDAYLTWAEVLRSQGFKTGALIQNDNAGPNAGLHQGFDEVIGRDVLGQTPQGILGKPAFDWLDRNAQRNFFLYLHALDPHGPYDPPAPFDHGFRKVPPGGVPVEHTSAHDPEWLKRPTAESRLRLYEGEIRHNDSLLPGLLRKLDELGIRENTLIVLTADHGEFLGEHGYWEHRPPGMLPVIHVPLMMSYPGRFTKDRRISQNVQLIDVMPTVLELAGVASDDLLMHGDSLVSLIEKRRMSYWNERISASEEPITFGGPSPSPSGSLFFRDLHMIWSRTFRVRALADRGGQPETGPRIFDFQEDTKELKPLDSLPRELSSAYWDSVKAVQANNSVFRNKLTAGRTEGVHRVDPAEAERLRELGYLQ